MKSITISLHCYVNQKNNSLQLAVINLKIQLALIWCAAIDVKSNTTQNSAGTSHKIRNVNNEKACYKSVFAWVNLIESKSIDVGSRIKATLFKSQNVNGDRS